MNQRSRSTLFLIEQLIVVFVFAVCAAACVRILVYSYLTSKDSKDVINAIMVAESGADSYKATAGDIGKTAEILGGVADKADSASEAIVYYDKQWQICGKDSAYYIFRLTSRDPETPAASLLSCELLVEKLTGENLVSLTVAARSNA